MKLKEYIKDHLLSISIFILAIISVLVLLFIFNVNEIAIIFITFILLTTFLFTYIYDFVRKRLFYNNINTLLNTLDKEYLITEIIKEPNFLEGRLLIDYLYRIDKSMIEHINFYKNSSNEFRDYIELWCHEIKTPLAISKLVITNNRNKITDSINEELDTIDNYIEQVLYYARSSNIEKDYIIKKINLNDVVDNVIKRNKKDILNKKVKLQIDIKDNVYSDIKWLEFIVNQIIVNSIKYSSNNPTISIKSIKNKDNIVLSIKDNGIGIEKQEVNKVFDKGFTGSNGRKLYNSTGIGLYLCQKLCVKLGHNISIKSNINEYTEILITFPINSLYDITYSN